MALPIFIPRPGFNKDLVNSDGVRQMLESLSYIEGIARGRARKRLGFKERGIKYEVGHAAEHGQLVGRLNGYDFKTGWYEFGTSRSPKDATLRRTVEDTVGPVTG